MLPIELLLTVVALTILDLMICLILVIDTHRISTFLKY